MFPCGFTLSLVSLLCVGPAVRTRKLLRQPFSPKDAGPVCVACLAGVLAAHACGIAYADILGLGAPLMPHMALLVIPRPESAGVNPMDRMRGIIRSAPTTFPSQARSAPNLQALVRPNLRLLSCRYQVQTANASAARASNHSRASSSVCPRCLSALAPLTPMLRFWP